QPEERVAQTGGQTATLDVLAGDAGCILPLADEVVAQTAVQIGREQFHSQLVIEPQAAGIHVGGTDQSIGVVDQQELRMDERRRLVVDLNGLFLQQLPQDVL